MNSFLKKFVIGEWNLGICNQNFLDEFRNVKKGGALRLRAQWVRHSHSGSFFADPFIYKVDKEKACVLAEEFVYSAGKGVISLCTINRQTAKMTNCKVVLEDTCHLSYPFFDEQTQRLSPESSRNGNWASYAFDGSATKEKKIVCQRPLIDCTPVEWHGKWYLFAVEQPRALDRLLTYTADSRYGKYAPHPLNPVKENIKTSRPGGKCFVVDGELYRIVQDSTTRYGEALHITHVTELTPFAFAEEDWCDIAIESDGRYPLGVHTLNFSDDFIVIDGYREVFRPLFAVYIYKIVPILRKLKLHR